MVVAHAAALFAALLVLVLTWVIATPRFGAPDEPAHVYKAYGVAHGELLGDPAEGFPGNLREFDGPASLGAGDLNCFVGKPEVPYSCVVEGTGRLISSAAPYPPQYYAVVGGVARAVGQGDSVRVMRMASGAMCAAALAAALVLAGRGRRGSWAPLILVGVTPTAWFLMGAVSPNAVEVATFALVWVALARLATDERPSPWLALVAGIAAGLVVMMRPVAAIWLVPVAVVALVLTPRERRRALLRRSWLLRLVGPSVVAVAVTLWWLSYARFDMNDDRTVVESSFRETAADTVRLWDDYLRQAAGELGWVDTRLPWIVYAVMAAVAVAVGVAVVRAAGRRGAQAMAVLVAAWLVLPFAINGFTAPTAGLSWQGRYALPFVLGVPAIALFAAVDRDPPSGTRWPTVVPAAVTAMLGVQVVALWVLLRRYTVGVDGPVVLTGDLPWTPSVAPMLLIAANAVAASAVGVLVLRSPRQIERRAGEEHGDRSDHGSRRGEQVG